MTGPRTPFVLVLAGMLLLTLASWGGAAEAPPTAKDDTAEPISGAAPPIGNTALTFSAPSLYPPEAPTRVRISILSAPDAMGRATRMAVLLDEYRRRDLEKRIGLKIELINVSTMNEPSTTGDVIYYRPAFLRAALLLAEALPGEQSVQPMRQERMKKAGIDVEIWVGDDSP